MVRMGMVIMMTMMLMCHPYMHVRACMAHGVAPSMLETRPADVCCTVPLSSDTHSRSATAD